MSSTKHSRQPHRRSGEVVREVVCAVVPERERERYMPFARELCATFNQRRKLGTVPLSAHVGLGAVQSPFSSRTKRVVMKWFRRGLHGKLLWRIGSGLLGRLFPDAATGRVAD